MTNPECQETPLSQAGEIRREAMLGELLDDLRRVHRQRRVRRRAAWSTVPAALALASGLAFWFNSSRMPDQRPLTDVVALPPGAIDADSPKSVELIIVRTDPSILEQYRVNAPMRIAVIDDDALLETLALLNRPAGLIRSQGRAWLTRDVTDAGLGADRGS